jgi:hypothetical protein
MPMAQAAKLLDVIATLDDLPAQGLVRGQVGTVVEELDSATVLVEFADDSGHAFALAPIDCDRLLTLHYVPRAA